jgi:uncharacterized protein
MSCSPGLASGDRRRYQWFSLRSSTRLNRLTSRCAQLSSTSLVVSPFVIAELDYLVATRLGLDAERRVLAELATGAYDLAQIDRDDIAACERVIAKHADQQIGVTDASLVVLAARVGTKQILTLDRRHFGVMRPLQGGRFVVVGATT